MRTKKCTFYCLKISDLDNIKKTFSNRKRTIFYAKFNKQIFKDYKMVYLLIFTQCIEFQSAYTRSKLIFVLTISPFNTESVLQMIYFSMY